MSIKKNIKSVSFLGIAALFGSGSTFIINMIIARELGSESYGVFSSAMATVLVFSIFASFGISQVWLKLFGEEGYDGIRWIKPSLKFIAINLIITSFSLAFWAFFGPHAEQTKLMLLIMIMHIFGYVAVLLVAAKYQLEEKYQVLSLWQLLPNISRLLAVVIGFYIFHRSLSILDISVIYGIIGFVFFVIGAYLLCHMQKGQFNPAGHKENGNTGQLVTPKTKELFFEALPFGLGGIFAFVFVQSDIIMLKYISGNVEAGLYAAAFVIINAIYLIPNILYSKFLMPKFHRWANHDRKKFYETYKKGNVFMLSIGIIFTLGIFLLADFFIPLIFGEDYINSISLLKVLSLTIPVIFMGYSVSATLVTKDNMKKKVVYMGIVALLNICLNSLLIPIFQSKGAAYATIFTNLILIGIYYFANNKYVFNNDNL